MARKSKIPANQEAEQSPRKSVPVNAREAVVEAYSNHAVLTTSPELAAYRVIKGAELESVVGESIDVMTMLVTLRDQATAASRGDLRQAEAMLMNQATALQSLFARLAERAMRSDTITPFEANMRMALRAQSQCRATLETLATIKNPPVVYAKQANISQGHQQVNNCASAPSQARKNENEQTQLSGESNELLPDARASGKASRVDPALEALGEIDGAKVRRG